MILEWWKTKFDKHEFWKGLGYSKKIEQLNDKAKNLALRNHERDQVKFIDWEI